MSLRKLFLGIAAFLTICLPVEAVQNDEPRFSELQITRPISYQGRGALNPVTVVGTIKDLYIIEYLYPSGPVRVLGLKLQTPEGDVYKVHLAPPRMFLDRNWSLSPGEVISIQGVMLEINREQALITEKIYHQDKQLSLRSTDGSPKWEYTQDTGSFSKNLFTPVSH